MSSLPHERIPQNDVSPTLASFYDLPNELLLNVVSQIRTKRALGTLRLLSRVLDEMVKDRVAERLSLIGNLDKVESMLSTPNTFDQSCGTLRIAQHNYPNDHYGCVVLAKLVGKMKGLHTIQWIVGRDLNEQVLKSISELPLLENLEVAFCARPSDLNQLILLPKPTMEKMKRLSIRFRTLDGHSRLPWALYARAPISYLIANAPALEHLDIGSAATQYNDDPIHGTPPDPRHRPLDLEPLIIHLQGRADFEPSIRSFSPLALKFPTSPSTMGFFTHLTTLHISNHLREQEVIWPALRTSGIRLTTIIVEWLSSPLIQYLHGYQGLRGFHLDISSPNGCYALDPDVLLLLTYALPGHHQTLTDLRFRPRDDMTVDRQAAQRRPNTMLWDIPTVLGNLHSFGRIERLDLVQYMIDMSVEQQQRDLSSNISAITSLQLTNLKSVHLNIIGVTRPCRNGMFDPPQNFRRLLRYLVEELKLGQQPSQNWRRLRIVLCIPDMQTDFPFLLYRFVSRIVLKEQDVYGLQKDLEETELLNEPGYVVER